VTAPEAQKKTKKNKTAWKAVLEIWGRYWDVYGGWWALVCSPYLHLSIVVTAALWPLWWEKDWWDKVLDIQPSMLGFTLGGFALMLAGATDKFGMFLARARVRHEKPDSTPLAKMAVAFVHFILMQMVSLLLALVSMAASRVQPHDSLIFLSSDCFQRCFWCACFFIFIYALLCSLAATEWIFRSVFWLISFNKEAMHFENKSGEKDQAPPEAPRDN